jgi:hypothetical protein
MVTPVKSIGVMTKKDCLFPYWNPQWDKSAFKTARVLLLKDSDTFVGAKKISLFI